MDLPWLLPERAVVGLLCCLSNLGAEEKVVAVVASSTMTDGDRDEILASIV